jgi:hypothetical protein
MVVVLAAIGCSIRPDGLSGLMPTAGFRPIMTASHIEEMPEPTATNSTTPVFTPRPTMTKSELITFMTSMSEDNGGCRLPCIWGIDPKRSDPQEITRFFEQTGEIDKRGHFAQDYSINDELGIGLGYSNVSVQLIQTGIDEIEFLYFNVYNPNLGLQDYANYLMPSILADYGKPAEIYMGPYPEEPVGSDLGGNIEFSWILFYPDQGFLADYYFIKEIEGEYLKACFQELRQFFIISWDPEESKTIHDVIAEVNDSYWYLMNEGRLSAYYKTIEEVMSINDFYETFVSEDHPDCIQAPKRVWDRAFYEYP